MIRILCLAIALSGGLIASVADAAEPFESVHCLKYAELPDYPLDAVLFGTDRGTTLTLPFVLCVAKRGKEVVVLDAGYVDRSIGDVLLGMVPTNVFQAFAEGNVVQLVLVAVLLGIATLMLSGTARDRPRPRGLRTK